MRPSVRSAAPLIAEASGLHTKATSSAISAGSISLAMSEGGRDLGHESLLRFLSRQAGEHLGDELLDSLGLGRSRQDGFSRHPASLGQHGQARETASCLVLVALHSGPSRAGFGADSLEIIATRPALRSSI